MADQFVLQAQNAVEGSIDFAGQKLTEKITTWVLIATGLIAFVVGYVEANIHYTLYVGLFGTLVTFLIVVPPWPAFNEDPEPWLNSVTGDIRGTTIVIDGKKVN